jgi:predicted nucleic acid-binding Zn ribbon protein
VKKLLSSPAIQFKGTGWYITDYAKSGKTETGGTASANAAKAEAKSESKADSKSETKTDSKAETKTETKAKTETKSES